MFSCFLFRLWATAAPEGAAGRRGRGARGRRGGADARYEIDEELSLSDVAPMIAKPFSPGNAFPAEEVARERLSFDKAMIGSCTNGGYDDLLSAALVIRAARANGSKRAAREFVI